MVSPGDGSEGRVSYLKTSPYSPHHADIHMKASVIVHVAPQLIVNFPCAILLSLQASGLMYNAGSSTASR